jgi:hypothetical protein
MDEARQNSSHAKAKVIPPSKQVYDYCKNAGWHEEAFLKVVHYIPKMQIREEF